MTAFPQRRPKAYDYSTAGFYFVTMCADFKECIFGRVVQGKVRLSRLGKIADQSWVGLEMRFPEIRLHEYIVMPNHVHGIIEIRARQAAPVQRGNGSASSAPTLSAIVRAYKGEVSRWAHAELSWKGSIWQRNYYDRVIRDEREFANASRYIAENPVRWQHAHKMVAGRPEWAQQAAPLQRGGV